jgi:hypothetical protein
MGRLALATVSLSVLVACGGMEPRRYALTPSWRLEADLDRAWEATLWTLTERGYEIRTTERATGTIETGWMTINPGYTATIFVTSQADRYSECGKPGLGQIFRGKQSRLSLILHPIREGETTLRLEAFFRTQRYWDTPFWASQSAEDAACHSRGRLEEEVRLHIQFRVLSDHLDRLRRGVP